jgi:nucleoside-diphosphate-sugar epimerase
MVKIAIIGAAGYVGQFMVDELNSAGIVPSTFTRSNGLFLLSQKKVNAMTIEQTMQPSFNEKFDVVINFAFPTGAAYLAKSKNDQIVNLIGRLIHDHSKIIHTSTVAVFGYNLDRAVVLDKVKTRRDWDYIESKIYMESRLLKQFKNNELHIVRLGNVWGPGSTTWTVALLNNILYGQATAVYGKDGFSNITDVKNISNYIKFIAEKTPAGGGPHFHHLAEFYDTRWSFWQTKLSQLFNMPIEFVYNLRNEKEAKTVLGDVKHQMGNTSLTTFLKKLYRTRVAGSYIRSLVNMLPNKYLAKAERAYVGASDNIFEKVDNPVFFSIMSGQVPFVNKTLEGWVPPVTIEQSWENIEHWLKEIKLDY